MERGIPWHREIYWQAKGVANPHLARALEEMKSLDKVDANVTKILKKASGKKILLSNDIANVGAFAEKIPEKEKPGVERYFNSLLKSTITAISMKPQKNLVKESGMHPDFRLLETVMGAVKGLGGMKALGDAYSSARKEHEEIEAFSKLEAFSKPGANPLPGKMTAYVAFEILREKMRK